MSWEFYAIALLKASLLRPLELAAAAWLVLRAFKIQHPASRHAVWAAVLAGMLLLPVLSVVAPHWDLPLLPAGPAPSAAAAPLPPRILPGGHALPPRNPPTETLSSFEELCLWSYLAGLLLMAVYRLAGWILMRRLLRRSMPLRFSRVRQSHDIQAPVTMGVLNPAVILPVGWRGWAPATRRAVLAHEFAHLRRRDVLTAALARLVKSLFWFHPLAWWVSRQVAGLAESACDAAALDRSNDPAAYSRMLVAFAQAVNHAGGRVALPGLAMAAGSGIGRRVDQVYELSAGNLRRLSRPRVWLVALGGPVLAIAAAVGLAEADSPAPMPQIAQKQSPEALPAGSPYRKWLNEDVAYIITNEERAAFKQLATDAQREKFIQLFWVRRDPTPATVENEFKEEHYRRIAYTNEHFSSSIAGWKTDRGRIYIQYGPPDEIESHPADSVTYAYQDWRYHYIQGIGNDIIVEFVDPQGANEYRMTMDPREKNARPVK